MACAMHSSLITGSMPGIAASTRLTCEFGSPPNSVEAPENSLDFEVTCACTSMPMITSQSPVAPFDQIVRLGSFLHDRIPLSTPWPVGQSSNSAVEYRAGRRTGFPLSRRMTRGYSILVVGTAELFLFILDEPADHLPPSASTSSGGRPFSVGAGPHLVDHLLDAPWHARLGRRACLSCQARSTKVKRSPIRSTRAHRCGRSPSALPPCRCIPQPCCGAMPHPPETMASASISTEPIGIDEARDLQHAGRRADVAEEFAMHATDRLPMGDVDEIDARADDVLEARSRLLQRLGDEVEDGAGLRLRVADARQAVRRCAAVVPPTATKLPTRTARRKPDDRLRRGSQRRRWTAHRLPASQGSFMPLCSTNLAGFAMDPPPSR